MAITITIDGVRQRFPEFANTTSYPDTMIQFAIDDALDDVQIYTAIADSKLEIMTYLLVAHYVYCSKRTELGDGDSSSPIGSKSLGEASVSYQGAEANSQLQASLNSTMYGQRFLTKLRQWRVTHYPWANL